MIKNCAYEKSAYINIKKNTQPALLWENGRKSLWILNYTSFLHCFFPFMLDFKNLNFSAKNRKKWPGRTSHWNEMEGVCVRIFRYFVAKSVAT